MTIVSVPKTRFVALLGQTGTALPFGDQNDTYFVVGGAQPGVVGSAPRSVDAAVAQLSTMPRNSVVGAAIGAGIAGAIQGSAEDTIRRAQQFHETVVARLPDADLAQDFIEALRRELDSKGLRAEILREGAHQPPRLQWPLAEEGESIASPMRVMAPRDSDLVVRVSPIAYFAAAGPLTAWRRKAAVGIAVFAGRSQRFISTRTIIFKAEGSDFEYATYSALEEQVTTAISGLRAALLSLVPAVAVTVMNATP